MAFWIFLTIVASAAAALLSTPMIRWLGRPIEESPADIEMYRSLLKEIETRQRQGVIDDAEAEAARIDAIKRALAADRTPQSAASVIVVSDRTFSVICVSAIAVLGLVGLYAVAGNVDPASPRDAVAERPALASSALDKSVPKNLVAALQDFVSEKQEQPRAQSSVPPVDEMIQRLAARLQQNPADSQGWRTLGWSYVNIGRFSEAIDAYAKAIELNPNDAEIRGARIEALVRLAGGVVSADARNAIEDTLRRDPGNGRARFYKGLASEQEGDTITALMVWRDLLRDADPNEMWVPDLRNRISALESDPGGQGSTRPGASMAAMAVGPRETSRAPVEAQMSPVVEKGPGPRDVQAAEAMAPADRSAMIRAMVDRLADRLEKSPRDADGWIKLVQSRVVLGEAELAKQALARGVETFTDDAEQRDRIVAAAQQLGVTQ